MNGTIRHARFTLGALGLTLLCAYGCSKESRPAREPTPTFESSVVEQQPAPTDQEPQPYVPPSATEAMPTQPDLGQPGMPQDQTPMPAPTPDVAPPPVDEMMICQDLTAASKIVVEDVQSGVAFVLTPKAGQDVATVKDIAHRVHTGMSSQQGAQASPSATECALFDIGGGAAAISVVEGPDEVRVLFTTSDPGSVKTIRSQAREFAKSQKSKANDKSKQKQNGANPGGTQR